MIVQLQWVWWLPNATIMIFFIRLFIVEYVPDGQVLIVFQPLCCNAVHYSVSTVGMERTKCFFIHTHQSLYPLHFARLCWTPFYRASGFLCSVKRDFWPYWRNSIAQSLQICWLLWCKSPISTTACQMCLIGWRSGDCRGHVSTVKLCSK